MIRTIALASLILLSGCATFFSIAHEIVAGADQLNGAAARTAKIAVRDCVGKSHDLAVAKRDDEADAQLAQCETMRSRLSTSLTTSTDATQLVASGLKIAEDTRDKNYIAVLAPVLAAARELTKIFADFGYQLPRIKGVN